MDKRRGRPVTTANGRHENISPWLKVAQDPILDTGRIGIGYGWHPSCARSCGLEKRASKIRLWEELGSRVGYMCFADHGKMCADSRRALSICCDEGLLSREDLGEVVRSWSGMVLLLRMFGKGATLLGGKTRLTRGKATVASMLIFQEAFVVDWVFSNVVLSQC